MSGQVSPKHEMRGVWIATVLNIDWPSMPGLPAKQQKREIDQLLDYYHALNFNTIILQVRPASDAFYRSSYEPWSKYLNGAQGVAPNPFYDPLDYFIEGCHQRGMELHAWLNPFRVKLKEEDELIKGHIYNEHPEWGWRYGTKTYLDPGIPAVRDYVSMVVQDIVKRYDIDAIHFDDYFYPYPIKGVQIPDQKSFDAYNNPASGFGIDDWRRENVNSFMHDMSIEVRRIKPWVRIGVSPFGVWRNNSMDQMGSKTQAGVTTYDVLFADVLLWLKNGWVDYLVPQIYWQFGHPQADFQELANWWDAHSYGKNIFVGHGLFRLNQEDADPAWKNPIELPRQIKKVREEPNLGGSVWFSSKHFFIEKTGFVNLLKETYYKKKALLPPSSWIKKERPLTPASIRIERARDHNLKIVWDEPFVKGEMNKNKFYVIYRHEKGEGFNPSDPRYIYDVVQKTEYLIRIPFLKFKKDPFVYYISAIDRLNNESELSDPIIVNQ